MLIVSTIALLLVVPTLASWSKGQCGVPRIQPVLDHEDRIVGGTTAVPGSWPWHVQLRMHTGKLCSGTLISDQHVLTAAHCVHDAYALFVRVQLGSHHLSLQDEGQVLIRAKQICMHPEYVHSPLLHTPDIAIIQLAKKVNLTSTIQPACLPKNGEELPEGSKLYATGWGAYDAMGRTNSDELKQTMIEAIPIDRCMKIWNWLKNSEVFCAGHEYGSICDGDSGGPVVRNADGKWTLHGIVSVGPTPCNSRTAGPQTFTKVSAYVEDFIDPFMNPRTKPEKIAKICRIVYP